MATKTSKKATVTAPALTATQKGIITKKFNAVNSKIEEAEKDVEIFEKQLRASYKEIEDQIKDTSTFNDGLRELKKIEGSLSSGGTFFKNIDLMEKQTRQLNQEISNKLQVIPIPYKITKLARWLDFWNKSAKKIYANLLEGKSRIQSSLENIDPTSDGRGFASDAFRTKGGYVSKDSMNQFMSATLRAVQAGGDPESVVQNALASLPPNDRLGIETTMGSVIDTLNALMKSDGKIYELTEAEFNSANVSSLNEFERAVTATNALSNIQKHIKNKKASNRFGTVSTLVKAADALRSAIVIIDKAGNETVFDSLGSTEKERNDQVAKIKAALGKANVSDAVIRKYRDDGTFEDFKQLDRKLLEKARQLKTQGEVVSDKNKLEEFLTTVTLTSETGDIKHVFAGEDIKTISALFISAFANLPNFTVDGNELMGLDFDGKTQKEALSVARMNLARIMEKIIAEKILQTARDNPNGKLGAGEAIYRRARQKYMPFGDTPEEIVKQVMFAIMPSGFPKDWTIVTALRQNVKVMLDGKEYTVEQYAEKSGEATQMLDPDMSYSSIDEAQGDHVIAYNKGATTLPRNLLALSARLNGQLKQDMDSGPDQILMTARIYEDLFGQSSELEWTTQSERQMDSRSVEFAASKIDSEKIQNRYNKIKDPKAELVQFEKEVPIFNSMESDLKNAVLEFDRVYRLYMDIYKVIEDAYDTNVTSIRSKVNSLNKMVLKMPSKVEQSNINAAQTAFKALKKEFDRDVQRQKELSQYETTLDNLSKMMKALTPEAEKQKLTIRKYIDLMEEDLMKQVQLIRDNSLYTLSGLMASVNNVFIEMTADMMKGKQAYRGSRILKQPPPPPKPKKVKVAAKNAIAKPTPVVLSDWQKSFLYQNKVGYSALVLDWKKAQSDFDADMKGKDPKSQIETILNTSKDIQRAMEILVEANEYVLFSEFFD